MNEGSAQMLEAEQLLERMRTFRGYTLPAHEALAFRDPEFLDGYDRMYRAANSKDSPLAPEVRELIVLALDVSAGMSPKAIRAHARNAIGHGATEAQVVAAIELAAVVYASKMLAPVASVFEAGDET